MPPKLSRWPRPKNLKEENTFFVQIFKSNCFPVVDVGLSRGLPLPPSTGVEALALLGPVEGTLDGGTENSGT